MQKLRIVRFLRTPDYDALFSGDPYWATESVGGMDLDGRTRGDADQLPHPHADQSRPGAGASITVLWSKNLPDAFKRYCLKVVATRPRCSTRTTT